jgi:hypothetical protein
MSGVDWNQVAALGQWAAVLTNLVVIILGALITRWVVHRARPRLSCGELRLESVDENGDGAAEVWLHLPLRVRSRLEAAREVEVHLVHAYDYSTGKRLPFDELNLKWTRRLGVRSDMPPAYTRNVDVACKVTSPSEAPYIYLPLLRESIIDWPATRASMRTRYRLGPGKYRLTIGVTARNADPMFYELRLLFDGLDLRAEKREISQRAAEAHIRIRPQVRGTVPG